MLTLLPLSGHAADALSLSPTETDQKTWHAPAEPPSGDEGVIDQPGPYANPYHPSSATNFDAFTVPHVPSPNVNDRSRLSLYLSDSAPPSSLYGHFDSPFFPDSINRRDATDHPYALDSPTNYYGRSSLMERR